MTNGGVFGGLEERKIELGYLRIRREVLTTPSSLYNSSLVIIKREEIMTKKKNARNEIKGKNQSFPFSNTIPSPIDDPSILSAPPYFDTAFARSHPIATLKITWVIFCFLLCVIWRFMITIRRRNIQFIPSCFFFVPKR